MYPAKESLSTQPREERNAASNLCSKSIMMSFIIFPLLRLSWEWILSEEDVLFKVSEASVEILWRAYETDWSQTSGGARSQRSSLTMTLNTRYIRMPCSHCFFILALRVSLFVQPQATGPLRDLGSFNKWAGEKASVTKDAGQLDAIQQNLFWQDLFSAADGPLHMFSSHWSSQGPRLIGLQVLHKAHAQFHLRLCTLKKGGCGLERVADRRGLRPATLLPLQEGRKVGVIPDLLQRYCPQIPSTFSTERVAVEGVQAVPPHIFGLDSSLFTPPRNMYVQTTTNNTQQVWKLSTDFYYF